MPKSTIILDCDGVLYPNSELTFDDFVKAMKTAFHQDVKLSSDLQKQISEDTIAKKHLGMFNYIKAVCEHTGYGFGRFCEKMQSYVDYSKISQDMQLFGLLSAAARDNEIVILTNNHISHLDKVLRHRFNKTVFDMENAGIKCFDIQSMERNGVFYPKQDDKALAMFAAKIGRRPQDCTLVDDTEKNVDAARRNGMHTVFINENFTLQQYLLQIQKTRTNTKVKTGRENG